MDQLDSLEDWVAIKDNPFLDNLSKMTKLKFKVSWNESSRTVTIDCTHIMKSPQVAIGFSRTESFTLTELNAIHNQLSLIHPRLGPYLPVLPEEPRGLWSYISPSSSVDSVHLCEDLHGYLLIANDICGEHLLTDTLFEVHNLDEYFEKICELRRRSYDEAVKRAEEKLQKVLLLRPDSINMLDMIEIYKLEDEAIFQWNIAVAELYNYLIQPFLDIRAPALEKLMEAKRGLQEMQWGDDSKEMCASVLSEWQKIYVDALDSIQELYIEYYNQTVALLTKAKDRMMADKTKFGQKSFEIVATDRFVRMSEDLCAERIQLFQNMKINYENQCDKVKQEVASLDDCPGVTEKAIAVLERKAYEFQVKVYDSHLDVLLEEEKLIRLRINTIRQEIRELTNEGIFYDAVENPEELDKLEEETKHISQLYVDPRLKQLDCKIATICRKKATIRNRKKSLVEEKTLKVQKKSNEAERIRVHHNVQLKRDENKAELQKKQDFINEERQKTIKRLKQYRMKYATLSTIRPPRFQPPSITDDTGQPVKALDTKSSNLKTATGVYGSDGQSGCKKPTNKNLKGNNACESHDDVDLQAACSSKILVAQETKQSHLEPMTLMVPADLSAVSAALSFLPPPPPPPPLPPPTLPPSYISILPPKCSQLPICTDKSGIHESYETKLSNSGNGSSGVSVNLKTIQEAKQKLRQRDPPSDKPVVLPFVSMMQLIRQKEKLRPVKKTCETSDGSSTSLRSPFCNDHIRHLQEALERINRSTRSSDDDDDEDSNRDFKDFSDSD